MAPDHPIQPETTRLRQYRSLLAISEAIAAQRDHSSLFKHLAEQLRAVVAFDVVATVLYDPVRNLMCMQMRESALLKDVPLPLGLPVEASPSGWAMQAQQPLIVPDTEQEERFPALVKLARQSGMRSYCFLPLTAAGRRLGALGFGKVSPSAFHESDLEFLQLVANQVAVAIENALNLENARKAEQEVKRQLEREHLMLEINNAVVSNLRLPHLLTAISASLRRVVQHDFAGLALYEADTDGLRVQALDHTRNQEIFGTNDLIPLQGTGAGKAFISRQTVLLRRINPAESPLSVVQQVITAGLKSSCHVPLIAHDQVLGTLDVMSVQEEAFTTEDAELLTQVGNQIAIAVENALNFERALKAEQDVQRQFERLRLMLLVNNATVTQLDLLELVRVISDCLREALQLAIAGVSLYDPEANCLRAYYYDLPTTLTPIEAGTPLPLEGSIAGLAFTSGQPVLLNRAEQAVAFPVSQRLFFQSGIQSGGCVPLIVQGRKLGVLGVDSYQADAFPEERQQLLCQIADQLALAVDNALNFERARQAERQAATARDRSDLLLEINNAVVSHLDLKELVKTVAASLRVRLPHDSVGIALYDPEQNLLREYANVTYKNLDTFREGDTIPLEGTPAGEVFLTGQPMLIRRPNLAKYPADIYSQRPVADSLKSACLAPLLAHGRTLGVVGVSSSQEARFTEDDLELFGQLAGQIAIAVENALAYFEIETLKNKLTEEKLYLEEEINTAYNFEEIIGSSPVLRRILKQVETVAPTDSTVLIVGETGTGKELIARAIHNLSARQARTLVKLNCAAIPSGLLESELFGHERGAFTGAIAQRIGRFELAHKGTLFLDEVGEIPLDLQPKLLRVLQEQEFERLGNARTQKVDVRLIAATNRDLAQLSAENKFRSDLYYRLNVFPLVVPPLRERPEDVPLLVRFFANKFALRMKRQIKTIPAEAIAALQRYPWPGNIRELENMIERAVILTQGTELHIPLPEIPVPVKIAVAVAPSASAPPSALSTDGRSTSLEAVEREHILRTLRETKWVVGGPTGAAARLGMKRTTLQNRMAKLGITRPS